MASVPWGDEPKSRRVSEMGPMSLPATCIRLSLDWFDKLGTKEGGKGVLWSCKRRRTSWDITAKVGMVLSRGCRSQVRMGVVEGAVKERTRSCEGAQGMVDEAQAQSRLEGQGRTQASPGEPVLGGPPPRRLRLGTPLTFSCCGHLPFWRSTGPTLDVLLLWTRIP
jgi:hypothetical protein